MATQDRHDYSNTFGYVWDVNTLRWVKGQQATLEADSVTVQLPNEGQQTMANSISVAIASDQTATPVSGPLTDAQLRATAVPISASSLPLPTDAASQTTLALIKAKTDNLDAALSTLATQATLAALRSLADTFKTRNDTFTATGNGTTVSTTGAPLRDFGLQVKGTGATPTSWDVRLEGSLDGANFSTILQHTTTTGDGAVLWVGAGNTAPVLYFRSRCAGIVLGGATNIVATILGMST